jgi:hypothetical protein
MQIDFTDRSHHGETRRGKSDATQKRKRHIIEPERLLESSRTDARAKRIEKVSIEEQL